MLPDNKPRDTIQELDQEAWRRTLALNDALHTNRLNIITYSIKVNTLTERYKYELSLLLNETHAQTNT